MKSKHEQLYVAVQDLLIELGITPKKLKLIVTDKDCIADCAISRITAKTAQKLIDADVIIEQINWRKSSIKDKPDTTVSLSEDEILAAFDRISSSLPPITLWEYLREKYPEFLIDQIKDYLFPSE